MIELSARIKDEHIQSSVTQNLKKKKNSWRWVWIIVLVALAGAAFYFGYRFVIYGEDKADQLLSQGQISEEQLNYTAALDSYDQALLLKGVASEPAAQAAFNAANIFSNKGQHSKAQEYLTISTELVPESIKFKKALALSYLETNDLAGAERILTTLQELDPQSADTLYVGALVALAKRDVEKAINLLGRATDSISAQSGDSLSGDSQDEQATFLRAAFDIHDNPKQARETLEALVAASSSERAIQKYTDLIEVARQIESRIGNDAYEQVLVGTVLLEYEDYYAAIVKFLAALEFDETYRDAWVYLASAELQTKQLTKASSSIQRAVELDPTYGFTRYTEGLILLEKGEPLPAIDKMRQAIDLDYDTETSRLKLSRTQQEAGLQTAAVATLEEALEIEEINNQKIFNELFWLYFMAENYREAQQVVEDYLDEYPGGADPLGLQALVLYFNDDKNEASKIADEALNVNQSNPPALLVRGLYDNDEAFLLRAIDVDMDGRTSQIAQDFI